MAQIKPFSPLRYTPAAGDLREQICPPYDCISPGQREAFLKQSPFNAIRLELPQGAHPYEEAAGTLARWRRQGILSREASPGFWFYEKRGFFRGKPCALRGLLGLVELQPFSRGVVLPHEEILPKPLEDRQLLLEHTRCQFSPIVSLYSDPSRTLSPLLETLCQKAPVYDFSQEGFTHRLWRVEDLSAIRKISQAFAPLSLYIADGHHRYQTALKLRDRQRARGLSQPGDPWDFCLMLLADMEDPALTVLPTHRLVQDVPGFSQKRLWEILRPYFSRENLSLSLSRDPEEALEQAAAGNPPGTTVLGCYLGGDSWELLTGSPEAFPKAFPGKSPVLQELDVSRLQTLVLDPLLDPLPHPLPDSSPESPAHSPENDPGFLEPSRRAGAADASGLSPSSGHSRPRGHLAYTRSLKEAVASVKAGESQCAFFLRPTKLSQIRQVAQAGEKMPQKSTYFYPKPATGLLFYSLEP